MRNELRKFSRVYRGLTGIFLLAGNKRCVVVALSVV